MLLQANGFIHTETVYNDRGPGVHTYYYTKTFITDKFIDKSIRCLGIIGGMGTYGTGLFIKTLSYIPRTIEREQQLQHFVLVNDPTVPNRIEYITQRREGELVVTLEQTLEQLNQQMVSHLVFLCFTIHPYLKYLNIADNVSLINLVDVTRHALQQSDKRWLLAATEITYELNDFGANVVIPGSDDSRRIQEIILEVKKGVVEPGYYGDELIGIAKRNNCKGIVLGCTDIHHMYGFDKIRDGVELFDPQIELALAVESSRSKSFDKPAYAGGLTTV
jgi:aspartate racemase